MNSRTRSRPPRGRGSSRSFVWKWYQSCGSSLYDWISRAWNVNVSSCVSGRTNSAARAVGDVEDLGDLVAAGRLPELDRGQHRREELLRADRVHLLADDLLDLAMDAPAERQERPQAGADLADEPAAHEQLVRGRLRVGGWSRRVGRKSCEARAIIALSP